MRLRRRDAARAGDPLPAVASSLLRKRPPRAVPAKTVLPLCGAIASDCTLPATVVIFRQVAPPSIVFTKAPGPPHPPPRHAATYTVSGCCGSAATAGTLTTAFVGKPIGIRRQLELPSALLKRPFDWVPAKIVCGRRGSAASAVTDALPSPALAACQVLPCLPLKTWLPRVPAYSVAGPVGTNARVVITVETMPLSAAVHVCPRSTLLTISNRWPSGRKLSNTYRSGVHNIASLCPIA